MLDPNKFLAKCLFLPASELPKLHVEGSAPFNAGIAGFRAGGR